MWYLPLYILTSASPSEVKQIRLFWGLLLTTKIGSSEHIHEQIDEIVPSSLFVVVDECGEYFC